MERNRRVNWYGVLFFFKCRTHVKIPFLCTVDGGVSGWGEWSRCDKLCQPGRMTRQKKCDNPKPKCGGKQCDLKILQKEIKECNYCPGNKPYPVLQCAIFLTTCK